MKPNFFAQSVLFASALFVVLASPAGAQSTSGVFGPVVTEGEDRVGYRLSYAPDGEGATGHRLFWEHGFSDAVMARVLVQGRNQGAEGLEYESAQVAVTLQLTPDGSPHWDSGVRFDVRVNDGPVADSASIGFANQWRLEAWRLRTNLVATTQVGDTAVSGVRLTTRANALRRFDSGVMAGVELFSDLGFADDMPRLDRQRHQGGATVVLPLGDGLSLQLGALAGLTDPAPDAEFRLWIDRRF